MKKSRVLNLVFALSMISLLSVFLLTFSVNVCASSSNTNSPLPYYINQYNPTLNSFLADNDISVNDIVTGAINGINGNHSYYGSPDTSKCLVFISDYSSGFNRIYFWLLFNPRYEGSFNDTSYNNFDYTSLQLKCDVAVYRVTFSTQTFTSTEMKKQSTSSFNMFGSINTVSTDFGSYTPNFPCGMVGFDELKDNSGNGDFVIVSNLIPSGSIGTGHATAPDPFEYPTLSSGSNHILPREVPEAPTINNYTWTTYNSPSIDTSTIESLLESLIYVINYLAGWLRDNLAGEFQNLISNITGLISFIVDTIQYYGGLIISNIQNGINTLYNNMVSLIEPIYEIVFKIGLFFSSLIALGTAPGTDEFSVPYLAENLFMPEPEDVQEIIETNDSLHIISNLDRIVDKVWTSETSIIKTLHNVTPVKKFHIPSCIYHGVQIGNFDIEFDWFENYKTYSDSIISTFLIIAWIYWFFVSISHIIRYGKTYDIDDTTKGVHF